MIFFCQIVGDTRTFIYKKEMEKTWKGSNVGAFLSDESGKNEEDVCRCTQILTS